ncbi:MAG: LysM domain-containing protein [Bacteroidota bacterium]
MWRPLTICFFLFISLSVSYGQIDPPTLSDQKMPMLRPTDTLFVSLAGYGQKFVYHKIKPNQTLYSLARFYGISIGELYYYNPQFQEREYHLGEAIKVPINLKSIVRKRPKDFVDSLHVPVVYKVKAGETMYRISRTYFKVTPDLLKFNNNTTENALSIDQPLTVVWFSIYGVSDSLSKYVGVNSSLVEANEINRSLYGKQGLYKKEFKQDGVAFWDHKGASSSVTNLIALHNEADEESIIQVHNPMSNRTFFVKVIGKVPPSYDPKVKVVLSSSAARALGAIDPNFHVKITYLK